MKSGSIVILMNHVQLWFFLFFYIICYIRKRSSLKKKNKAEGNPWDSLGRTKEKESNERIDKNKVD